MTIVHMIDIEVYEDVITKPSFLKTTQNVIS